MIRKMARIKTTNRDCKPELTLLKKTIIRTMSVLRVKRTTSQ